MNPRINDGGLQLGASCRNRHHDRCPRDIDSSVSISVIGIAALNTAEGGLTLAVLFGTVSALATRFGRIARVNSVQWYGSLSGLIGEEQTQLTK